MKERMHRMCFRWSAAPEGAKILDEILAWLNGAGELILCTEPDKVFRASIYNKISVSDMIYLYNSFLLQFRVQPLQIQCQCRRGCFGADRPDHHPQQRHSIQRTGSLRFMAVGDITLNTTAIPIHCGTWMKALPLTAK